MKVDITIQGEVAFPIEERPVLRGYPEYEDLPEDARVRVYSLREIAAEKVLAVAKVMEALARRLEARGQELKPAERTPGPRSAGTPRRSSSAVPT